MDRSNNIADRLEQVLRQYALPAYGIKLTAGEEPSNPYWSKFRGQPYSELGEQWPVCKKCSSLLEFLCQIDLREFSDVQSAEQIGLIAVYYCFKCAPWQTSDDGWLVRKYAAPSATKAFKQTVPEQKKSGLNLLGLFKQEARPKPLLITSTRFDHTPEFSEMLELGAPKEVGLLMHEGVAGLYGEVQEKISGKFDDYQRRTMIGGWSEWFQSAPKTVCDTCGGRLKQLLQIGSNHMLKIMFGKSGAMFVRYCPLHPHELKMDSQSYERHPAVTNK